MSTDDVPEIVEVPVDRVEVEISLDTLLDAVAAEAVEIAEGRAGERPNPEVAKRLKQLGRLAGQLTQEVREVKRIDSRVARRLETGRNRLRPEPPGRPGRPGRPQPSDT
jgi:hypothetical protein